MGRLHHLAERVVQRGELEINPDGTFSIQTDAYTAAGSLKSRGADYAFEYERNGQTYAGTLVVQQSAGRSRLVGHGETPNGPMDITLTR